MEYFGTSEGQKDMGRKYWLKNRRWALLIPAISTAVATIAMPSSSFAKEGADLPSKAQGSCNPDQGQAFPRQIEKDPDGFQSGSPEGFQSLQGVYRPFGDECSESRDLERISCNGDDPSCVEDHGTYVRDKFYFATPVKGENNEKHSIRLISDGTLDIILTRDTENSLRFNFDIPGAASPGHVLIDGPECLGQDDCFVVRNIPDDKVDSFGIENGAYASTPQLGPVENDEDWGNVFVNAPASFRKALQCYDVRTLDENAVHAAARGRGLCRADSGWLLLPGGKDKTFKLEVTPTGHRIGVPYGMTFQSRNTSWGGEVTEILESEKEINDNRSNSVGWKTGINLIIFNTEVHNNKTTTQKKQDLTTKSTTNTKSEEKEADFAVVLDRFNLKFTTNFKVKVANIAKVFDENIDEAASNPVIRERIDRSYKAFIEQSGTHVPYATTFGKRAFQSLALTKEAIQNLAEDGVSVSRGASAGLSMPVPELGGTVGANFGVDSGNAQDHAIRIKSELGRSYSTFTCFGGSSCHGKIQGAEALPIFLDLMPVSELLGPPFFHFSGPHQFVGADRDLFEGVTMDDMLALRDDLRKYIARKAFLTDKADIPSDVVANQYVQVSRIRQVRCFVEEIVPNPDGRLGGDVVRRPYDGAPGDCKVTDIKYYDTTLPSTDGGPVFRSVSAGKAIVFERPHQEDNGIVGLGFNGTLDVKPTVLCKSGGGEKNLTGPAWGSLTTKNVEGTTKFKFGFWKGFGTTQCRIMAEFEGQLDIGGAAQILDAD